MHTCTKALLVLALASLVSATVVGIDFGTEYFKVSSTQASLIKPGKKLAIVENTQSKRMTPNMVAFTPQERLFGADAQVLRVKIPQASIAYSLRLLGQTFNDTAVQDRIALEDWPYSLVENTERGTFNYSVNADVYSVESIVGMVLEDLKTMAEVQAEGSVKDCVITIPAFFTRAQRMELVQVAEAAGLNVISLIHENTAAALYHGIDRMDNETSYFAIIYNLGASYLQTSLVKYSTADVKLARGSSRTIENIEVLAHSWDKDLGGSTFDALITEYLAQAFLDKHGVDPHLNQRAMAKLIKKANEVKKTLSAGKSTQVYIEALMDGKDLVTPFDRETFEALLEPLVPRLVKPVQDVLEQSGVSIEEIGDIELVGGVTRVPKVQETLRKAFGRDLSNHLNGDESMAHGAALFAANYTSEVQLRPMYLTDIVNYDIEGDFYDEKDLNKQSVLFKKGSRLGTKKKITLTHDQDFKCKIKHVYEQEAVAVDLYSLGGVAAFSDKHQKVPVNHMTFVLTFDGFAYLYEAEARLEVEEVVREKVNRAKEVPSDETKPAEEVLEPNDETKPTEEVLEQTEGSEGEHTEDQGEDKTTETEQILEDQHSQDEQTNISEPTEEASETEEETEQPTEDAATTEEDEFVERSVTKTLKDRIKVDKEELELPPTLTHEQIRSLQRLLKKLTSDDKERKRLAEAKNEVEGYLYYLRDKLSEDDFVTVTTEEERTQLGDFLTHTETWLEDTESPEVSTYSARTSELKAKSQAALSRLEERENRSHVVEQAYKQIEAIRTQLDEFNKTKSWVSAEVKDEVYKKANETQTWLEENVILQDILKPSEAPILTQVKVEAKIHALERSFDIAKRTPKPKAEKKSKLPSDFIKFGGGMDGSNIKMDNVTIDGEEYSPEDTKLEL
jgi:hypoxia up-regulated 1